MNSPPLIIGLNGTLLRTDMLHESALKTVYARPLTLFCLPYWLIRGKNILKQRLARTSNFAPQALPFNQELLGWLKEQHAQGRALILCTASAPSIAKAVADYLGIFDEIMTNDENGILDSASKATTLEQRFGHHGFDYVGHRYTHPSLWRAARRAVLVDASDSPALKNIPCEIEKNFPPAASGVAPWRRMLRVHQWLKNLLLFMPMLASHEINNMQIWQSLIVAFCSFSLCASSVYIFNDLLDLESDRQHPRKRLRPFASGIIQAKTGMLLAPLFLVVSMAMAWQIGMAFFAWLLFYFVLTCLYSWALKRMLLIDCLTLAMLYTLRIVAGAAAADMSLSFWLLAFAVFLFLSLAFVKRYAELEVQLLSGQQKIAGRGYLTTDAPLIQTLGVTSGYASVVVFALYLNSDMVVKLYRMPEMVWGAVPVLLFWISWIWMQAHRGKMHDDPLIFAVKDKTSIATGIAFAVVIALGALWPW